MRHAIGIDLGGTTTAVGLVAEGGELLAFERFPTKADGGPERWTARVRQAADSLEGPAAQAVGAGSPGPLDLAAGAIVKAANLGWRDVPLKTLLEDAFSLPVAVDNDAVAATVGEWWAGAGRGAGDLVGVTLGTGVGGGLILGGAVVRGARGIAGHLGHVIVEAGGRRCTCGNEGCLEAYVSAPALVARCLQMLEGGGASVLNADESLTARRLAEAAEGGDALAAEVFREAAGYLAVALTSVAVLVDPEVFVISGAVAGAGEVLLTPLRQSMEKLNFHGLQPAPRIVAGELGVKAGVIGAAGIALRAPTSE